MVIEPGRTLLHYRLVEKIGEGGMGVVWKAQDTTLDRDVAIKILPELFSQDPERLARFEREARLLASLNHPNIATVHGLHECEGRRFLSMELVAGEDLAARLRRGPLSVDEALTVASQVAAALEVAHSHGVVHRDLKPANVVLTPEGTAKVLDFGLAKTVQPDVASSGSLSMSPTVTSAGTVAGVILGTAAYMSPEQARGKPVDRRADLWALGCLLHECLTGRQIFGGETVSDTLAAILRKEPDWSKLPAGTPWLTRWLLGRCLTRDPAQRLQDAGEARILLEQAIADPQGSSLGPASRAAAEKAGGAGMAGLAWALAALLGVTSIALAVTRFAARPTAPAVVRASLAAPPDTALIPFDELGLALSPDGGRLAFVANERDGGKRIWIRDLSTMTQEPVPETDAAWYPFWSPDGTHLGFFSDGKLKRIDLRGGSPRDLADAPSGRGGSWSREDVILFAPNIRSPIHSIPADGGTPTPVTQFDPELETTHRWPHWLPDSKHFVYVSRAAAAVGELGRLVLDSLDGAEPEVLIEDSTNAVYVEPGYLIYGRAGDLTARRFDAETLRVDGEPIPMATGKLSYWEPKNYVPLTASDDGTIVYLPEATRQSALRWFDRSGRPLETIGAPGFIVEPRISPDATKIALVRGRPQSRKQDVWIHDLEYGREYRLTLDSGLYGAPRWSPDSSRLAFVCQPKKVMDLCVTSIGGASQVELLYESPNWNGLGSWTADGSAILFSEQNPDTLMDVWILDLDEPEAPRALVRTPFSEYLPEASPDGRRFLYESDETGRPEIYLRGIAAGSQQWQLSANGGQQPRWRGDGREVFFVAPDGKVMALSIETEPVFHAGAPTPLFELPETPHAGNPLFEHVTPDGGRFLLNLPVESRTSVSFHAILHWSSLLPD